MRRLSLLALVVLVWCAAPAESASRVPDARVDAVLASFPFRWTPAARAWALETVPVTLDPEGWRDWKRLGFYARTAWRGPYVVVAYDDPGYQIEHEMHHAWDEEHHQTEAQRAFDMRLLARWPGLVGVRAREVLDDPTTDNWHYTHALIEKMGWDVRDVPDWFKWAYYPYLVDLRVRVLIPVALRR